MLDVDYQHKKTTFLVFILAKVQNSFILRYLRYISCAWRTFKLIITSDKELRMLKAQRARQSWTSSLEIALLIVRSIVPQSFILNSCQLISKGEPSLSVRVLFFRFVFHKQVGWNVRYTDLPGEIGLFSMNFESFTIGLSVRLLRDDGLKYVQFYIHIYFRTMFRYKYSYRLLNPQP